MAKTHAVLLLAEDLVPKLSDPAKKAEVHAALEALLERVNGQIEAFERLGFFVVAKDRWTIQDGHLTPTMKIRRNAIEAVYADHMKGWYDAGEKVIWEG